MFYLLLDVALIKFKIIMNFTIPLVKNNQRESLTNTDIPLGMAEYFNGNICPSQLWTCSKAREVFEDKMEEYIRYLKTTILGYIRQGTMIPGNSVWMCL